jgi:predicted dehydrogenase
MDLKGTPSTRRRFLHQTASAAVLAWGLPALAQTEPKLKLGFLGAAHSHFLQKHKVLSESPDFTVLGVEEADREIQKRLGERIRWLEPGQVLAEADVVVVESAVKHHARHAQRALIAGRHVHVEKPPATNLADFEELLELANRKNRVLQVGYMWRYNPGINAALEAARQGWLGKVFLVRGTMNTFADPTSRQNWSEFSGGAMFEQGCHLVDVIVRLLGRPNRINHTLKSTGLGDDLLIDNTVAVFEYPQAAAIVTSASAQPNAGPQRCFEIIGSNGSALVQPLEQPQLVLDLAAAAGPYAAGRQTVKLGNFTRYVDEFSALAAAIRGAKPLPVLPTTEREIQETLLRASDML